MDYEKKNHMHCTVFIAFNQLFRVLPTVSKLFNGFVYIYFIKIIKKIFPFMTSPFKQCNKRHENSGNCHSTEQIIYDITYTKNIYVSVIIVI